MTMNQQYINLTASAHDVATPAINLNMSAGDNDITRLCIYKKLKE